jgi:hypothetical protein
MVGQGTQQATGAAPPLVIDPTPDGATRLGTAVRIVSWLVGIGLIVQLVRIAGSWDVAANTRTLDLLIRGGLVRLTDMDSGYIDGVPIAEQYVRSQSPIDWLPLIGSAALVALAVVARAVRFGAIAAPRGHRSRPTVLAVRADTRGRFVPFGWAERRLVDDLTAEPASPIASHNGAPRPAPDIADTVIARRALAAVEIALFATVAVVLVGLGTWLLAMTWALALLAVSALVTRDPHRVRERGARRAAVADLARSTARLVARRDRIGVVAATFLAFPLEEAAGYLVVQSLSSDVVILGGVTPSVLLVALVAGKTAAFVPITPGGLGLFEWGFAAALYAQGQGLAEAVTITLVFTVVRYVAALALLGGCNLWLRRDVAVASPAANGPMVAAPASPSRPSSPSSRTFLMPEPPTLERFAKGLFVVGAILVGFVLLQHVRLALVDYWLLDSLGYASVFGTNLAMAMTLFVLAATVWTAAVLVPLLRFRDPHGTRRWPIAIAVVAGLVGGLRAAGDYRTFLLFRHGRSFDATDPVFGYDIGFYVFDLPAIRAVVWGLTAPLAVSLVLAVILVLRRAGLTDRAALTANRREVAARLADPLVLVLVGALGVVVAVGLWLRRFDVLIADNYGSSIATGAEALDVDGFVSTVNLRAVEALVALLLTGAIIVGLLRSRRPAPRWAERGPSTRALLLTPVVALLAAHVLVLARDVTQVTPNEPVAQLEYLARHIGATNTAWGMDDVVRTDASFAEDDDPLPDLDAVLEHPAVVNVQLWPGATSWLERLLDPQHVDRLFIESDQDDPDLVFATTLDTFRQHQKLRPYYDFLDVDVVNYPGPDGSPRLYASSVRELPLLEPQPWLAFWGQRFVLFTHGYGLVAAPLGEVDDIGGPVYASADVPPVAIPELSTDRNAIYYGEGSGTIGFSNVEGLAEFDFPTDQDRADVVLPESVDAGIRMDSFLKRLVFSIGVQEFFDPRSVADLWFSDLITDDTRIHVQRQPIERVRSIAPFLFLDSDPYAVVDDDGITWMVNGVTTADRYPYSAFEDLGDKSVRRGPFPTDVRRVNYAADSVKATVDAYTGAVTLYRISDEPVVATWSSVYPDLFAPSSEMPDEIREHQQYPPQLFHTQFDDHWIYYHVTDPIAFFNQEDLFDDADEVLGPMLAPGDGITFSVEPYPTVVDGDFALAQVFTPEGARNLRSIVAVRQGASDYGELTMLQVPKGSFVTGPEQAESIIDQDAEIAQQFGFWNSTGVEVIRGYISPVVVDDELLYVEPVFIRSEQNPFPQLARVVVVMRGRAAMADTTEEAIRRLYDVLDTSDD